MRAIKVQSLRSLRDEMIAVARGERKAPAEAARPSFDSVGAMIRLLTPENRRLLALIRDGKPDSIASLAAASGRSQPNLSRTLAKLEAAGLVAMRTDGRRKKPVVTAREITIRIDPFSRKDRLEVA
jgi:predicted transcriptional regulator